MDNDSVYEFQPEPILYPEGDLSLLQSLTPEQWVALEKFVLERRTKSHPKLIDIRFLVDVVFSRFYVVLMVGKDRRTHERPYPITRITKIGNTVAAVILLLSANLVISSVILLSLYLTKSALGIDFMPGHVSEQLKRLGR